jgi:hypothetical protein
MEAEPLHLWWGAIYIFRLHPSGLESSEMGYNAYDVIVCIYVTSSSMKNMLIRQFYVLCVRGHRVRHASRSREAAIYRGRERERLSVCERENQETCVRCACVVVSGIVGFLAGNVQE